MKGKEMIELIYFYMTVIQHYRSYLLFRPFKKNGRNHQDTFMVPFFNSLALRDV